MREYELTFIVHPDLDESGFNDTLNRVIKWINDGGGEITKRDIWGKRKLAYPIRKQTEGQYVLLNIKMPPALSVEVERNLRITESILRYLIVLK